VSLYLYFKQRPPPVYAAEFEKCWWRDNAARRTIARGRTVGRRRLGVRFESRSPRAPYCRAPPGATPRTHQSLLVRFKIQILRDLCDLKKWSKNLKKVGRYQLLIPTLESSPEAHVYTCRVSSRVSSHCFFQEPSPESSCDSSVSNPSLRESLPKFSSHFSSHYSAIWSCQRNWKCTQDSKIALEMLCNGTMSEFIRKKASETIDK